MKNALLVLALLLPYPAAAGTLSFEKTVDPVTLAQELEDFIGVPFAVEGSTFAPSLFASGYAIVGTVGFSSPTVSVSIHEAFISTAPWISSATLTSVIQSSITSTVGAHIP